MKFAIEKAAGLAALQRVAAIVNRKHTIPILTNVLIVADSLGVHFRASDLDIESTAFAAAAVAEPGVITAKADVLAEIMRGATDGNELVMSHTDGDGRMLVKTGRSRFNVQTLPAGDFPRFGEDTWDAVVTIQAEALAAILGRVGYAMSNQDVRYILKSTHVHALDGGLRMVATDGHVLATRDLTGLDPSVELIPPICIPASTALHFQRALSECKGEVTLSISKSKIRLDYGDDAILSKLLDGGFPDYPRVIPREFTGSFIVPRDALAAAVRRMLVMSTDKAKGVKFETDGLGTLILSSRSPDGDATDELQIENECPPISVGFNGALVLETLAAISGAKVECRFVDKETATAWAEPGDEGGLGIIMPLRV